MQAQRQAQAQAQRQSRTPFLSGILGQNKPASSGSAGPRERQQIQVQPPTRQEPQEPQHLGVFGTRPLFSGFKNQDSAEQQARDRQSQEFHARSQHLNAAGQPGIQGFAQQRSGSIYPSNIAPGDLTQASTNPAEANEALAKIPWNLFPEKTKARFQQVASSPTMYRRLPMAGGRCNPELFDFFLTYPNTIVELWKQMGYDEVDMKQIGQATYAVSEKDGSGGKLTILYQTAELAVAHVVGTYRGAGLIRPVEGEAFLVLQVRYTEDQALTPLVVCRLDAFVSIKNPGVDLMARAFNSMIGKIADTNFEQTLAFIDSVSQTAEQDPRQFQSVVAQLGGLSPEARRALADKTMTIALQAQQRDAGKSVNYRLLAKANDPNPGYARILARGANQTPTKEQSVAARPVPKPSFQGYNTPELNDEFFEEDDLNASFAESGFHLEDGALASKPFVQPHELNLGSSDDFSLASDDASEYEFTTDDEEMMTGEEYLATHSLSTLRSADSPNSLAKLGPAPSKNARALQLAEEDAELAAPFVSAPSSLSTDQEDEELVIDSFALEEDENESAVPRAIPLSRMPGAPSLPSTVRGLNAPSARPNALNAAPLAAAEEEEQYGDVAEISLDENGNPMIEFTDDEEETDEAADVSLDAETDSDASVDPEDAPTLASPLPETAPESDEKSQEPNDEETEEDLFEAGGWTRSALANRAVSEKIAKTSNKAATKSDETIPERPKLATKRYAPPLEKSNGATAVKTIDESKANGERVATYRWSPVPGAFVAKTAALPREENTLTPKTARFAKPEIR